MAIESIFIIITSLIISIFIISSLFFYKNTTGVLFICSFAIIVNVGLFYFYKGLTGYPRHATEMTTMFYPYEDEEVEIMQFYLVPNKEILLTTKELDSSTFMLISVPWDEELAQALHEAKEDNKKNGSQTKIKFTKNESDAKGKGKGKRGLGNSKNEASGQNNINDAEASEEQEEGDKKGTVSEEEMGSSSKRKYDKNNIQIEVYRSFELKE